MTPGAVKLRESLQPSWRVYLLTKHSTSNRFQCALHWMFDVLCRKHRKFEKCSKHSGAFRLPLRHEVGERAGVGMGP